MGLKRVVAGCYERFLFGLDFEQGEGAQVKRSFTYAAHQGPVKCVAAAAPFLASGAADDLIHIYNLQDGTDLGFLVNPGEGAVTAVTFFTPRTSSAPTHLLTGSADGTVAIWKVGGNWDCLKVMRGHRKDIHAISVHPSGAMALSVGRDSMLRMWDLAKGRCVFHNHTEVVADWVEFSPSGKKYALICGNTVLVHLAEEGSMGVLLQHEKKVLSLVFFEEDSLATGSDDGSLSVWDTRTGQATLSIPKAHKTRIRALALVSSPPAEPDAAAGADGAATTEAEPEAEAAAAAVPAAAGTVQIASASSDGVVKVWELRSASAAAGGAGNGDAAAASAKALAEIATGARLTCLCAVPPQRKRKHAPKADRGEAAPAAKKGKASAGAGAGKRKEGALERPLGGKVKKKKGAEAREGKGNGPKGKPEVDVSQLGLAHDGVVDFVDPEETPSGGLKPQGGAKSGQGKSKKDLGKRKGGQQQAGNQRQPVGKAVSGRQPVRGFISKKKSRAERR